MKKHLVYLILSSFCLSPFVVEASWKCWRPFGKKKPSTLLEELHNPELTVKSTMIPGRWSVPLGHGPLGRLQDGQPGFSFAYTQARNKKEKGEVSLLFKINVTSTDENSSDYRHWIHWESDVENPHMDENTVKIIFNKVYQEVYGVSLEWMTERDIIPKTIIRIQENKLSQFDLYDVFNFNSLLFKDREDQLRRLIARLIAQMTLSPDPTKITYEKTDLFPVHLKMTSLMRKIALESYSPKELKTLPPERIKKLNLEDVRSLYDTPKKIKTLDMSSLAPEIAVKLLTEHRDWRAAVTATQIKQLDVRADGIQYVFAPTFKHFVRVLHSEEIRLDALSDKQIMNLDRDTFLRDVFLVGEVYVKGHAPPNVQAFILNRKIAVKESGYETIMRDSLPKETHDFITTALGFDTDFESMSPQQRRKLFRKEISMMTSPSQQFHIIEGLASVAATVPAYKDSLNEKSSQPSAPEK